jgi:hypothetical protein
VPVITAAAANLHRDTSLLPGGGLSELISMPTAETSLYEQVMLMAACN